VSVGDALAVLRVGVVAVSTYRLVSAGLPEVVVVEERRGVDKSVMGVKKNGSENSKRTPTRYIPTLSFLHHCLVANAMFNPAVSTSPAIVRNRESPLGILASLGKILRRRREPTSRYRTCL
jgi:hypothetical protein